MGAVYEAEHLSLDRRVALKLLKRDLASSGRARARFEREARAAGRVDHDNVCEVIDVGVTEDGAPFLAMPLLRGQTLGDLLSDQGALDVSRAADIMRQVLSALSAAHGRGLIHRDLKPDNVFLTKVGDRADFVKLLDFGIAKLGIEPGAADHDRPLTDTGAVMGTPHYMSPEQARGARAVDERADLYAAGVILYEMLTGQRPIRGESTNEILWKIWNEPLTPPIALRPDLPPSIDAFVVRAMARDRNERFCSAEAMTAALEASLVTEVDRSSGAGTLPTLGSSPPLLPAPGSRGEAAVSSLAGTELEAAGSGGAVGKRVPVPLLLGGVALLLVVVTLGVVSSIFVSPGATRSPSPASARAAPVQPAKAPPVASEPVGRDHASATRAGAGGGPADGGVKLVRLSLVGIPEGAVITYGGRAVEGSSFMVAPSTQELELSVEAAGYHPLRHLVAATSDATIPIRLRPLSPAPSPSTVRTSPAQVEPGKARSAPRPVRGFGDIP
jgi:serine/threonine-protein kinase